MEVMYAEGDYEVEKVEDVRELNGEIGYFVKWKGWPSESNSWVAACDMCCAELINEFEKREKPSISKKFSAFKRGYQAEKILEAFCDDNKVTSFLIKFQEKEKPEKVSSKVANVECSQMVIKFYENQIEWIPRDWYFL